MVSAALVLGATLLVPSAAGADTSADKRAAAQALFDDARRLIAEKKWSEACPKLEESQNLDPGLGTLLNLAECQSQIGKTASAWANFLEAAYQAKATNQTKRESTARAHAAALEPRLSRLTILAVGAGAGVEIRRDGIVVALSLVGTAVPVDPGEHTVSAAAPGKRPWSTRVTVKGDAHLVSVSVPQLEDAAPGEVPPPVPKPPPSPPTPRANGVDAPPPSVVGEPPPTAHEADTSQGPRIGGIALAALGGAGLVAGAALTGVASQKNSASDTQGCDKTTNVCMNAAALNLRNDARTFGNAATGAWVAGGVLAAGGVALIVTSTLMKKQAQPTAAAPTVSIDGHGRPVFGLSGKF
jgi:hypothetical protein